MKPLCKPPALKGLNSFSDAAISTCIKRNGLLSLWVEPSLRCNYKCVYCYTESSHTPQKKEMSFNKLMKIISEGINLGLKSVVIVGGEPLVYPDLDKLIRKLRGLKITPVIFTNASSIDRQKAQFFFENGCSVVVKLDSLRDSVQDALTSIPGSLASIRRSLDNLRSFNFNSNPKVLRLGVSAVITSANLNEILNLWKFCRKNMLFPHFEPVGREGYAKSVFETLGISMAAARSVYDKLLEIDESQFNFTWNRLSALPAINCKQLLYSLNVTANSTVTVCNGISFVLGDLKKQALREVLDSDVVRKNRDIYKSDCYGCRARAYNLKGDMYAADPIWQP